jgi:hypothetical protein
VSVECSTSSVALVRVAEHLHNANAQPKTTLFFEADAMAFAASAKALLWVRRIAPSIQNGGRNTLVKSHRRDFHNIDRILGTVVFFFSLIFADFFFSQSSWCLFGARRWSAIERLDRQFSIAVESSSLH